MSHQCSLTHLTVYVLLCHYTGAPIVHCISSDSLSVPSLTVPHATSSVVEYNVQRTDDVTNALIAGYKVIRFGVPMIGEYVNTGRGGTVTISPAVPGAQYRITAWALTGEGRRSTRPAVVDAATGETSKTVLHLYV